MSVTGKVLASPIADLQRPDKRGEESSELGSILGLQDSNSLYTFDRLGAGRFGQTWCVTPKSPDSGIVCLTPFSVAVKILSADGESDRERFLSECDVLRTLSRLGDRPSSLPCAEDHFFSDALSPSPLSFMWVAMTYMSGRPLGTGVGVVSGICDEESGLSSPRCISRAVQIAHYNQVAAQFFAQPEVFDDASKAFCTRLMFAQSLSNDMLNALTYLHNKTGHVHRDLSPGNILVDPATQSFRLIDLGLVTPIGVKPSTDMAGTPGYLAPLSAAVEAGPWVDAWSLGLVFWDVITGMVPFVADGSPGDAAFGMGAGLRGYMHAKAPLEEPNLSRLRHADDKTPLPELGDHGADFMLSLVPRGLLRRTPKELQRPLDHLCEHPWLHTPAK